MNTKWEMFWIVPLLHPISRMTLHIRVTAQDMKFSQRIMQYNPLLGDRVTIITVGVTERHVGLNQFDGVHDLTGP